jgi:hypothetical protein
MRADLRSEHSHSVVPAQFVRSANATHLSIRAAKPPPTESQAAGHLDPFSLRVTPLPSVEPLVRKLRVTSSGLLITKKPRRYTELHRVFVTNPVLLRVTPLPSVQPRVTSSPLPSAE